MLVVFKLPKSKLHIKKYLNLFYSNSKREYSIRQWSKSKLDSSNINKLIKVSASCLHTNNADLKFPLSTKVVICGGGLFGTSTAYHLAQLGYKDVILVTRDKLGSGTTFYSTGVVSIMRLSTSETIFTKYSANLYDQLQNGGHDLSKIFYFTEKSVFK
jgi:UDP-galactopyranose mutase